MPLPQPPRLAPLLIRAGRNLHRIRLREYASLAIGPTQRDLVLALDARPNQSLSGLAHGLGLSRVVTGRIVRRLVLTHVVEKVPVGDGRKRPVLRVTPYGRTCLKGFSDEWSELETIVRHPFHDDEASQLANSLTQAVATLEHVLTLPPGAEFPPLYPEPNPFLPEGP